MCDWLAVIGCPGNGLKRDAGRSNEGGYRSALGGERDDSETARFCAQAGELATQGLNASVVAHRPDYLLI